MNADYYECSAEQYAAATASADLSALYAPFLARVRPGGRILDVGCGAGRDLAAFCARGYAAEGIEPSPRLAAIARSRSGAPVRVMAVQELDIASRYDGIWACASLLHVPRSTLPEVLARLARALAPGGALWFSVKEGQGEAVEAGPAGGARTTVHYDETELLCVVGAVAGLALEALTRSSEARPAGPVGWISVLALCKADTG